MTMAQTDPVEMWLELLYYKTNDEGPIWVGICAALDLLARGE